MLIKAEWTKDKIQTTHAERIDETMAYCHELRKDDSNGFTRDRTMRRIGSPPMLTLMEYDRVHPGFFQKAMSPVNCEEKNKAWRQFFASDYGRPFLMVDKILH